MALLWPALATHGGRLLGGLASLAATCVCNRCAGRRLFGQRRNNATIVERCGGGFRKFDDFACSCLLKHFEPIPARCLVSVSNDEVFVIFHEPRLTHINWVHANCQSQYTCLNIIGVLPSIDCVMTFICVIFCGREDFDVRSGMLLIRNGV